MTRSLLAAAALVIAFGFAGWTAGPARAADVIDKMADNPTAMPVAPGKPGSDSVVILVSDTAFGPSMEDANAAARYYCTTRGKLYELVAKEHPPELHTQVFQQWSVMTYRCVPATVGSAQ